MLVITDILNVITPELYTLTDSTKDSSGFASNQKKIFVFESTSNMKRYEKTK